MGAKASEIRTRMKGRPLAGLVKPEETEGKFDKDNDTISETAEIFLHEKIH